jgi:hypothetical protein
MRIATVRFGWGLGMALMICGAIAASKNTELKVDGLELHYVKARAVNYAGRDSLEVTYAGPAQSSDAERFAVVRGSRMKDGVVEVDLTGDTTKDASPTARGFVGLAFRISGDRSHFECIYLRPKNGRAEDQLQRNHATQYVSMPGYPWEKLRAESPGKYESYVDLVAGQWTHIKIVVEGKSAKLFVNGAEQPSLVVNDLKQEPIEGGVALWVGPGTVAHFAGLQVDREKD